MKAWSRWQAVIVIMAGTARAMTLSFATQGDFTNRFVTTRDAYTSSGGVFGWTDANGGMVRGTTSGGNNGSSFSRFDSVPADGVFTDAGFLTNRVSALFRFSNATVQPQFTLALRMPEGKSGYGLEARATVYNVANNQFGLYVYYDARSYGGGTQVGNRVTVNLGARSPTAWYRFVAEVSDDADPVVTVWLRDANGNQVSSFTRTITSALSNDYDGPGAVGFRTSVSNSSGESVEVDDFTIDGYELPPGPPLETLIMIR